MQKNGHASARVATTKRKQPETQSASVSTKRSRISKAPVDQIVRVYSDGNAHANGTAHALAGSGVFVCNGAIQTKISSRVPGRQTSSRAELFAMALALRVSLDMPRVAIFTDSKYTINGTGNATKLDRWRENGWKLDSGGAVINTDLWSLISNLLHKRTCRMLSQPEIAHVPGHSGVEGNEMADELATAGMEGSALTKEVLENMFLVDRENLAGDIELNERSL